MLGGGSSRQEHVATANVMETVFNCSQCDQELSVDSTAVGSEIECPTCGSRIVVPTPAGAPGPAPASSVPVLNTIKTSAAAREEHHFSVPVHDKPGEQLIQKPNVPLDVAAKEGVKLKAKTIRRIDCVEVGHDRFDDIVTGFLNKVGEDNIISVTPLAYTYLDIGTQKLLTDYGVLIIHKT